MSNDKTEDLGASSLREDRVTDERSPEAGSPPSGSVPTGAATVADILDKAADLIEPEGAWTQGADSRNAVGVDLDEADPDSDDISPVCWCAGGAIFEAADRREAYRDATAVLAQVVGIDFVPEWNDAPERTQPEVVAKLREAAAVARERGI